MNCCQTGAGAIKRGSNDMRGFIDRRLLMCCAGVLFMALIFVAAFPCLTGEPKPLKRFEYAQVHMGVKVRIVTYAECESGAEVACMAAFKRLAELEDIFSDYRPRSELMRLCANAGGAPVKVSDELFEVLECAQRIAQLTDGAFDVTVGPLTHLWRKARRLGKMPSKLELQEAMNRVGWRKLCLDASSRTVQLLVPGMLLDLGGIAKGYMLDCALNVLRKRGIKSALIEAGGDIVVSEPPPNTIGWKIMLAGEFKGGGNSKSADKLGRIITVANSAVATSGDTEQFVEIDGVRYSHIVDPRVGLLTAKGVIATVIASNGMIADALATVLYILGDLKQFNEIVKRGEFKLIGAYLFKAQQLEN